MFISFVEALRRAGIPRSLQEHLLLLQALEADVFGAEPEKFYYLARRVLRSRREPNRPLERMFAQVLGVPSRQATTLEGLAEAMQELSRER